MASGTPILPQLLWSAWNKYDKEELAHHQRVTRIDCVGLSVLVASYVALVFWLAPTVEIPLPSASILVTELLFTAIAVYNLHLQNFALVKPSKLTPAEYFVTDGPLGRFIWMTHQAINLVAVHFLLSAFAPFVSTRLAAGTYAAAVPVGGLALFVTIQFFLMVYPLEETVKEYKFWAERGVHMELLDILRHAPPGVLAVIDVLVLKNRDALLQAMPSMLLVLLMTVVYVSSYLAWTRLNYKITGQWQYSFFSGLGFGMEAWLSFSAVQGGILFTFPLALSSMARLAPAFW